MPAALSLSAAALSASEVPCAFGAGSDEGVAAEEAAAGVLSLSRVLRKTSNIDGSVAGFTESCSLWVSLDGSTPNASPMHCTIEALNEQNPSSAMKTY